MDKDMDHLQASSGIFTRQESSGGSAGTPVSAVPRPHTGFVSIAPTERLSRVDGLHIVQSLNSALPVRLYVAAPLTELPVTLFPYLFATAEQHSVPKGSVLVEADSNRHEYLAVLEGELEVQSETAPVGGAEEFRIGRLMKSAESQAIVLLHTIPRRSTVRALTAARVIQLDSLRVEALRGWMLRCDARRKPGKFRH